MTTAAAEGAVAEPAGLSGSAEDGGELLMALANTDDAIDAARVRMDAFLAPLQLSPRTLNRLEVVLEELVTNIQRHGFGPGAERTILARVAATPDAIELTLEDDGAPFDPTHAPPPPPLTDPDRLGGFGLPVVRRFCSAMTYEAAPRPSLAPALAGAGYAPVNRLTVTVPLEG